MPWIRAFKRVLMPPAGLLWLAVLGAVLASRGFERWGWSLVVVGLGGVLVLGMPVTLRGLVAFVDRFPPLDLGPDAEGPQAEAIVLLDGGIIRGAREYPETDEATVNLLSLERLRYGAALHRRTSVPVLVTGPYAKWMIATLRDSFGTEVSWSERASRNTHENARFAADILVPEGVRRVLVVTHFWHMPRALAACRAAGFDALPAPMGFFAIRGGLFAFVPQSSTLFLATAIVHEWIGLVWYQLRYGYGLWR